MAVRRGGRGNRRNYGERKGTNIIYNSGDENDGRGGYAGGGSNRPESRQSVTWRNSHGGKRRAVFESV